MAYSHPLFKYREDKGLSREALGKELGVSDVTVGRWEKKQRRVDVKLLPKVSQVTGIPKSELRPDLADAMSEVV